MLSQSFPVTAASTKNIRRDLWFCPIDVFKKVSVLICDFNFDFASVVLNEGGNHGINGFFAENSHIIVLGGNGPGDGYHFQNPRPALIYYDSVKRGNLYYHISYSTPISTIMNLLKQVNEESINSFICFASKQSKE